jgi:methyl-accepting chemotaxis protein
MIVICDKCGLKYKVDPTKIKGDQARLTCRGCSHVITVNKQDFLDDQSVFESAGPTTSNAAEDRSTRSLYDPAAEEKMDTAAAAPQEQKRSGMGLTTKVILLMLLVSLLPGAIYFTISFQQTNQRIKDDTNRTGLKMTEILTDEVNEWADKNIRVLTTLAQLPAMESMDRASQEIVLRAVQKEYPWMYLVHTIDLNGMNVARSDNEELMDYASRQYVQDVKNGKALALENVIGKTSNKPALVLAVPIQNNGKVVGVLASAMTLDAISKIVVNWGQGQTGQVFIVDQNGKVIAHPNEKFVLEQKDFSKHPLIEAAQKKVMTMVEFKDLNKNDSIGFARKTLLNWTLAVQQDKREAFSALKKAQTFAFLLLAGTIITIVIIAYIASRAIVTPIRKLTEAANRISVGELSVEIVRTSQDEIGDLADAITRMQDSIRLSILRLRRKKR